MRTSPPNARHPHGSRLSLGAVCLLAALAGDAGASTQPDNQGCLRCHQMATLAYRDPANGEIVNLAVDPEALAHSAHGELACADCHQAGFGRYPHPASATAERLDCVGCHERQDEAEQRHYRFATIEQEFRHSIHAVSKDPSVAGFGCHSCHDPHRFQTSRVGEPITSIVRQDNQICLACHQEVSDPLRDPHTWLPKREKHREAVRCLDCHTPLSAGGAAVSHQILAAAESNRDCVNCHSRESRLLNRLYRYRSEQELADQGWLSQAVLNQAYVVGMSRSPLIDRLALAVIGLTLLGLTAHGYGRYLAQRRLRAARTREERT